MGLDMIVTVKQVPDTHNVSGDAMKPDGTVNRAILPAIFNPEDLNALEEALKIKETFGGKITVVTMGPPNAEEVLRQSLYRGADDVVIICDRRFAGADTLATSYALKCAVEKIGKYDLILCGRQAIDGDTAQVGPQLAEKLKINQLTCVSEIVKFDQKTITVKRSIEGGYEILKTGFPALLTVMSDANTPRSASAKRVMIYKNLSSKKKDDCQCENAFDGVLESIKEWNVESIEAADCQCGLSGSPTKVKKIQNVVLAAHDVKSIPPTAEGINGLVHELIEEHIIG